VEESKVELTKNKLILSQINSTLLSLPSPQFKLAITFSIHNLITLTNPTN